MKKSVEKYMSFIWTVWRLAMWIDCNAIFYGAYLSEQQALQLAGENIPMPEIE